VPLADANCRGGSALSQVARITVASFSACRDALRYIALREDFKTARVDGKPLVVLFSGEGLESHMGQMETAGGRR
jgi:hypothetical protein